MKNKDKYKTPKERHIAFCKECRSHRTCVTCQITDTQGDTTLCSFKWLELEAKTSKDMISDFIEEVSNVTIGDEKAKSQRVEMMTKLLSHRDKIQQIWQAQDNEPSDD